MTDFQSYVTPFVASCCLLLCKKSCVQLCHLYKIVVMTVFFLDGVTQRLFENPFDYEFLVWTADDMAVEVLMSL